MFNCPKCGSPRVHRSRSRGFWERTRKNFTQERLHRCHGCGWRGWGPVTSEAAGPEGGTDAARPAQILEAIDIGASKTKSRDAE